MQNNKLVRLLSRFSAASKAHYNALEVVDEVEANGQARNIMRLYDALLSEGLPGQLGLLALIDSDSPVVAGMAALYSMYVNPDSCLSALRRIAMEPGLIGFRASVFIDMWESGTWEHPRK